MTRPEPDEQHVGGRHALEEVVHRRDAAVGVAGGPREPQQLARALPIDWKARAGDGAGAQRVEVRGLVGRCQAGRVALQLLDHRQQVVRHRRRLGRLRVRVGAVDRIAMPPGQVDERGAQLDRALRHRRDELPLPDAIHRHRDVVAAARGVQAAADVLACGLLDQALDEEEQVLVGAVVGDLAHGVERDAVQRRAQDPRVLATTRCRTR